MNHMLTQQRVRITFGKHGALRFIGHLDLSKTWERVLRRAQIPLEYTQGFNPRPRLQFAAALPVGVTSESEYLDAWLTARLEGRFPDEWIDRLNAASPPGLRVYTIEEVPIKDAALPTQVTTSEFVITLMDDVLSPDDLQARVSALLAIPRIERETQNKKRYDLRPRILDLSVDADGHLIALLSSNERSNARPDELVDALSLPLDQVRIHRRRLHLDSSPENRK
jgi:radical SAM-linked protein